MTINEEDVYPMPPTALPFDEDSLPRRVRACLAQMYKGSGFEARFASSEYDDALIGIGHRAEDTPVAVYSLEKLMDILVQRDGMDIIEAQEHFDHKIMPELEGKNSPIFVEITIF